MPWRNALATFYVGLPIKVSQYQSLGVPTGIQWEHIFFVGFGIPLPQSWNNCPIHHTIQYA